MAMPKQTNIQLSLLKVIADSPEGKMTLRDAVVAVEKYYPQLTEEDKKVRLTSGNLKWQNRVQFVRQVLVDKEELDTNAPHGIWKITDIGKKRLEKEWPGWKEKYSEESPVEIHGEDNNKKETSEDNPVEKLDVAYKNIIIDFKKTAPEYIMRKEPSFLENLIKDLLIEIYEISDPNLVKVTGRTGDGGIDGECYTDALGVNKIIFQAKRWQNSVGPKDIREFGGALDSKRINNGIFVTTSNFTKDAEFAAKESRKIKLIDGEQLVELMIKYKVGVIHKKSLIMPAIDENYFSG